jgi:hypothetical protein
MTASAPAVNRLRKIAIALFADTAELVLAPAWRVRWSIRQLCCSGVLVATNHLFALVTASQMAPASAASFLCHLA